MKNIIFDLGGVILNIDYQLTARAFQELGTIKFERVYNQHEQSELFNKFETGKIIAAQFRETLQMNLNITVSDEAFDQAWNAMLLDLPQNRLKLLEELKSQYHLFLFSNTNEIHLSKINQFCQQKLRIKNLDYFFDKAYYSHIFGFRKPNHLAFQKILIQNKLAAYETLFIDDSIQHIKGAQLAGIKTIHLTNEKTLIDVFK